MVVVTSLLSVTVLPPRKTVALPGSAYRTVRWGRVGDKNLLADSCYSFTLNRGSPFRRGLLGYRVRSRVAKVEFQPTMSYSLQAPFKCQNNSASRVRICGSGGLFVPE